MLQASSATCRGRPSCPEGASDLIGAASSHGLLLAAASTRCSVGLLEKSERLRPVDRSIAFGCAMRLLAVIIVALASVLLLQGVALAHGSGHHDRAQAPLKTSMLAETEIESPSYAGDCRRPIIATVSEMMFDVASGTGAQDVGGDWNARDDREPNDDCCGVACHAVVGGRGDDRLASHLPSSPIVLTGASELLGIKQRRLERPPRRC